MKRLISSTVLIVVASAACGADKNPLANYFGNTLHVATEGGPAHTVYYYPDNTFEIHFPDSRYRGTYTVEGMKICLTAIRPGDTKESTKCHGFDAARKPGESWSETTPRGVTHLRLEAGRPDSR